MYTKLEDIKINPLMSTLLDFKNYSFHYSDFDDLKLDGTRPFIMYEGFNVKTDQNYPGLILSSTATITKRDYTQSFQSVTSVVSELLKFYKPNDQWGEIFIIFTDNKSSCITAIKKELCLYKNKRVNNHCNIFSTAFTFNEVNSTLINSIDKFASAINPHAFRVHGLEDCLHMNVVGPVVQANIEGTVKKSFVEKIELFNRKQVNDYLPGPDNVYPAKLTLLSSGKISSATFNDMSSSDRNGINWYDVETNGSFKSGPSFVKFSAKGEVTKLKYYINGIDLEKSTEVGSTEKLLDFVTKYGQITDHMAERFFGTTVKDDGAKVHIEAVTLQSKVHYNRKVPKTKFNYILSSFNEEKDKKIVYVQTDVHNVVTNDNAPAVTTIDAFTGVVTTIFIRDGIPGIKQEDGSTLYYIEIGKDGAKNFYVPHPSLAEYSPEEGNDK